MSDAKRRRKGAAKVITVPDMEPMSMTAIDDPVSATLNPEKENEAAANETAEELSDAEQSEQQPAETAAPQVPVVASDAALEATLKLVENVPQADKPSRQQIAPFQFPDINGQDPLSQLGPALKNRRESMGLSFTEITRRTCMAQSTVIALETMPLDKLDASFYIKNRLALYATVLDIEPEAIQKFFETTLTAGTETKQQPGESKALKRWLVIGISILLVVAAVIAII